MPYGPLATLNGVNYSLYGGSPTNMEKTGGNGCATYIDVLSERYWIGTMLWSIIY